MTARARLKWPKNLSPTTLILTPFKQHLGCCVVVPLLLKFLGGVALVQAFIRDPAVELIILGLILPVAVWLILKGEDTWRARHSKKHDAAHDPCDHHCMPAKSDFWKRYALNLSIAFAVAIALHLLFHHHAA